MRVQQFTEAYESLANAVILQAVVDYEAALSEDVEPRSQKEMMKRDLARKMMREIERFARDGAAAYSDVNLTAVLEMLRSAKPAFDERARRDAADIIRETRHLRQRFHSIQEHGTRRCPLDGGVLYDYRRRPGGRHRIKCTTCFFWCDVDPKEAAP